MRRDIHALLVFVGVGGCVFIGVGDGVGDVGHRVGRVVVGGGVGCYGGYGVGGGSTSGVGVGSSVTWWCWY